MKKKETKSIKNSTKGERTGGPNEETNVIAQEASPQTIGTPNPYATVVPNTRSS